MTKNVHFLFEFFFVIVFQKDLRITWSKLRRRSVAHYLTLVIFDINLLYRSVCIIYFQLLSITELLNNSLFDVEVSEVFVNHSIPPCLARSVQFHQLNIGLTLALSYFLDSLLKEFLFDRLTFFFVAAWLLFSARLIFIYDNMAHLSN